MENQLVSKTELKEEIEELLKKIEGNPELEEQYLMDIQFISDYIEDKEISNESKERIESNKTVVDDKTITSDEAKIFLSSLKEIKHELNVENEKDFEAEKAEKIERIKNTEPLKNENKTDEIKHIIGKSKNENEQILDIESNDEKQRLTIDFKDIDLEKKQVKTSKIVISYEILEKVMDKTKDKDIDNFEKNTKTLQELNDMLKRGKINNNQLKDRYYKVISELLDNDMILNSLDSQSREEINELKSKINEKIQNENQKFKLSENVTFKKNDAKNHRDIMPENIEETLQENFEINGEKEYTVAVIKDGKVNILKFTYDIGTKEYDYNRDEYTLDVKNLDKEELKRYKSLERKNEIFNKMALENRLDYEGKFFQEELIDDTMEFIEDNKDYLESKEGKEFDEMDFKQKREKKQKTIAEKGLLTLKKGSLKAGKKIGKYAENSSKSYLKSVSNQYIANPLKAVKKAVDTPSATNQMGKFMS